MVLWFIYSIGLGCGVPPSVKGAVYSPLVPCLDHGCSFTFTCKNKYELEGESSLGNNIVTCGEVHDGMWDFGVLRCIGMYLDCKMCNVASIIVR